MPRIPSATDVSAVGASASRIPALRADAADFGLGVAQGLDQFGEGLVAVHPLVEEILRKEEQREEAEQDSNATSHRAAVRQTAIQMVDGWEYDGSSPRVAARRFSKELAAAEDARLKELPPERQMAARASAAGIRAAYSLHIAQRAQNASVVALDQKMAGTLQLLQGQAAREPLAAERFAAEGTALLQSQAKIGALTPEQFAARNEIFRRGLFAKVIQRQPAVDAVADLEAGVYDAALDDPELKDFLLTQAAWRLQAEQAQGRAVADGLVEAARQGATEQPALRSRVQRLLDADAMADSEMQAERARRVRLTLEAVRYAPEQVVRQAIAAPAASAGAADAEERVKLREEVHIQGERMLRERRYDPAAYAMGQPTVAEAFAAAEHDPTLLSEAVAARLAAQAAMGLLAEEQRALTREESAQIVTGLATLMPAARAAALSALAQRYGDRSGVVAADLAEAGLSPLDALLIDSGHYPAAGQNLAELMDQQGQGKQVTSPAAEAVGRVVDEQVAHEHSVAPH